MRQQDQQQPDELHCRMQYTLILVMCRSSNPRDLKYKIRIRRIWILAGSYTSLVDTMKAAAILLTLISTSGKSVSSASKPGKYWTVYRSDPP